MSEQNWIITLCKQDHLDETEILTSQAALPRVLAQLLEKYPAYTDRDIITIRPTDMTYHE